MSKVHKMKRKKRILIGWVNQIKFTAGLFPVFKTKIDSKMDYEVRQLPYRVYGTKPTKVRIIIEEI